MTDPFPNDPNERTTVFHQQAGFYAERLDDGSVRLVKQNPPTPIEQSHGAPGEVVMDHTIPAAEWASIVAAVSVGGETSATYQAALNLHSVPTPGPTGST